ncbi:hypothetical protein MBLNU457_5780t2 [Dothideomycetes sp. NU457]
MYWQEGTSPIVTLEEDDPDLVVAMLEHCYSHDYAMVRTAHCNDKKSHIFDAEMFRLADKYQSHILAEDNASFIEAASKNRDHEWFLLSGHFFEALDLIYDLPSGSLLVVFRKMFKRAFARHLVLLLKNADFRELYGKHHNLAADCVDIVATLTDLNMHRGYECRQCWRSWSFATRGALESHKPDFCPSCGKPAGYDTASTTHDLYLSGILRDD